MCKLKCMYKFVAVNYLVKHCLDGLMIVNIVLKNVFISSKIKSKKLLLHIFYDSYCGIYIIVQIAILLAYSLLISKHELICPDSKTTEIIVNLFICPDHFKVVQKRIE